MEFIFKCCIIGADFVNLYKDYGISLYTMSRHYNKLTEVMNDIAKDIMTISDLQTQFPLLQEFDKLRKSVYNLLNTLQEAKEKVITETSVFLPDVVIKAKLETNGLTIQQSWDYAKSLTSLTSEYREMVHDFIHVYAYTMLSAFMIVDGKCLTTEVTRRNVAFGKFMFERITVDLT